MKTRWLAVLVFLVVLTPRLVDLNRFSTWDELFWTHASLRFWRAVQSENWSRTYIIGQPGVVSMWLGSAAVSVKGGLGGEDVWENSRQAGRPRYTADDLQMLGHVADEWPTVTPMTALFVALAVAGMFILMQRLVGTRAALVGAGLLAFDPFFLAHSRVMALDAVLASLMTLSLLALLVYLFANGGSRYLVAAGALGGLAALQKTTGLFLVGFVGLALFAKYLTTVRVRPPVFRILASPALSSPHLKARLQALIQQVVGPVVAWAGLAAITYVVVWPAMWTAPVETFNNLYHTVTAWTAASYDPSFYLGEATTSPGAWFYPLVALFRTPPLTWLGLALLAWRAVRREAGIAWGPVLALISFALLFAMALTLSALKFDRYLLPALVPLTLAAGMGLSTVGRQQPAVGREPRTSRPLFLNPQTLVIGLFFLIQTIHVLWQHPYYLAWYNPLIGGQAAAVRVLPLGWGEGMEQAADYLARLPDADQRHVASWSAVGLAPRFRGQLTLPIEGRPWRDADYYVVYITDRQRREPIAVATERREPLFTGRVGELDYVWVYARPE